MTLSRIAIVGAAAGSALLFAISVPLYYSQYIGLDAIALGNVGTVRSNLSHAGISLELYALYNVGLAVGLALACYLVSAIIFWRKPREPMALIMAFAIVLLGATYSGGLNALIALGPLWAYLGHSVNFLNVALFYIIFLTFPNGRFVPDWTRPLYVPIMAAQALSIYLPGSALDQTTWPPLQAAAFDMLTWAAPVIAQLYRYRRVSDAQQRQQTKWVVYGFATSVFAVIAVHSVTSGLQDAGFQVAGTMWDLLLSAASYLAIFLIPLSLAIAILRYRLYDIDVIIRRTLVYGSLTAMLALIYWGGVAGLQVLLRPLVGEGNDLVIVASTLLIAALFMPMRQRIQGFVDRRFYRRKYDAARTLAQFGQVARDEVDLNTLAVRLMGAVEETMQPAHISLWLRPGIGANGIVKAEE